MKLEFTFTDDSKFELRNLIRETLKEEVEKLLSTSKPKELEEDVYLSRKQACEFLGCSLTTLYYYQKKGLLPYHQVGRKILFNKSDLLKQMKIDAESF